MERREFIKVASVAACAAALLPSLGGLATGCTRPFAIDGGHEGDNGKRDFDEIIDRSGTWSIKHERATEGQIPMWIADMDFRTAPAVSSALKERLSRDALGYTMTPKEYYQSIIGWEKEMHGWKVEKEWVAYCLGVITSINQAYLTFTNSGDSIIVMPPVYNLFRMYAERLGRNVIDNPLLFDGERYRMDLNGLERLLSDTDAKMLVLCNPHNLAGVVWDSDALRRVASLCRQKGVIVISDEIHADPTLPGYKAIPPQASFLVWLDCRAMGLSQEALMKFFSDQAGLLLSNGDMYGQGGEGFVRMNIGCPRSVVKEALERIL
ncbi:MAG: aminotransferase class I/II-fold pyridoxal phosphate-dependent enzyme [Bacteroidales bacterium]|nr:aminotransferase class I/II-fold pyridoxal phosphate-dependent enzyme [Bacteroidales bacterium]